MGMDRLIACRSTGDSITRFEDALLFRCSDVQEEKRASDVSWMNMDVSAFVLLEMIESC